MLVYELIAALRDFDPNTDVMIEFDGRLGPVRKIEVAGEIVKVSNSAIEGR